MTQKSQEEQLPVAEVLTGEVRQVGGPGVSAHREQRGEDPNLQLKGTIYLQHN